MQAVLSARARLHAIFNLTEVKSVGGYFPNLWRIMLDFAQDPETDVLDWLHSGVPFGIESTVGTNRVFLEIYGASTAVEAFRLCGVAHVARWDSSSRRNYKSLEEASEHVKPEIERQLSKSYVRRWPS